eukprot:597438-Pleurochrysis_carterae.AAC.2
MNACNSTFKHLGARPEAFWVAFEGKHATTNGLESLVGRFVASQLLVRRGVIGQGGVRKAVADVGNVQKAVRPVFVLKSRLLREWHASCLQACN